MSTQWSVVKSLPEPHGEVLSSYRWRHSESCTVEYISESLQALHDAGCIDAEALRAYTTSRKRIVKLAGGGLCSRERLYHPFRWRLTILIYNREAALRLPGVSEPFTPAGMVQRSRSVGRLQRPVQWTVVEDKLIVIDWRSIRAGEYTHCAQP